MRESDRFRQLHCDAKFLKWNKIQEMSLNSRVDLLLLEHGINFVQTISIDCFESGQ